VIHRPQRLGFLRFWEMLFACVVLLNITALLFESHTNVRLGLDVFLTVVDTISSAVILWLIMQRKRVTVAVLCAYTVLVLAIGIVNDLAISHLGLIVGLLFSQARLILLLACAYFLTSRRVRTTLVKPFDIRGGRAHAASEWELYRPRDPEGIDAQGPDAEQEDDPEEEMREEFDGELEREGHPAVEAQCLEHLGIEDEETSEDDEEGRQETHEWLGVVLTCEGEVGRNGDEQDQQQEVEDG
jgi:hypothetical protein